MLLERDADLLTPHKPELGMSPLRSKLFHRWGRIIGCAMIVVALFAPLGPGVVLAVVGVALVVAGTIDRWILHRTV
jgi:hypothetical protein